MVSIILIYRYNSEAWPSSRPVSVARSMPAQEQTGEEFLQQLLDIMDLLVERGGN
jgi:hypothetical protein